MKYISTIILLLLHLFVQGQIPDGYYDGTEGLTGEELKIKLHTIIDNHEEFSYSDLRDFILKETDEDPNNPDHIILLYSGRSQPKNTFGSGVNNWNREHVWAKSHGGFGNRAPAGTDAHHIRPTDVTVNSSRSNLDFDNGGEAHDEATSCYYDHDSWEPRDEVKGDVARMLFYMAVRYEGDDNVPDLEVVDRVATYPFPEHGKLSTLLLWNTQDPPSDFERKRNNVIYGYQKNRNPFIDHPEFANKIWGSDDVIEEQEPTTVKAFPNPTKEDINIVIEAVDGEKNQFELFSSNGKKINISPSFWENKVSFKVKHLSKGVYFIKWHYHDEVRTLIFVKD